jgi:dTDP-4-dehydrorhamnose reductase
MKILISGGHSNFSKELQEQNTEHEIIPLGRELLDVIDPYMIECAIVNNKPDVLIHTAALSRPMIKHTTNPEESISLNIIGTANCVNACMKYGVKFVYISTDYVYPGDTGDYKETDAVYPVNKYAWSKLGGECAVQLYDNSMILRMAMMEKPFPHDKAFTDVYKSCIWYPDAAKVTLDLISKDVTGTFNVGGERKSIYNFVKSEKSCILEETKLNINEPVPDDVSMDITKLNDTII